MTPVPILLYHSVDEQSSSDYQPWCVHPDEFDAHLDVVTGLGYTPMTVSGLVDARAHATLPDKPCVITFDDGRADFVEHAAPLLVARSIPATMYVVSGHVGGTSSWLPIPAETDQPMMTWDDLRSLDAAGIEIGAHSETHPELDLLSPKLLESEVATSRIRLGDGLGREIRSFAYPHGYHSRRVAHAVRRAGFDSASAVKHRWSHDRDDLFALARMFVWGSTSAADLHTTLTTAPSTRPRDGLKRVTLRTGWRHTRRIRRWVQRGRR